MCIPTTKVRATRPRRPRRCSSSRSSSYDLHRVSASVEPRNAASVACSSGSACARRRTCSRTTGSKASGRARRSTRSSPASGASGGGGIRTRGPRERTPVFKTGAFDPLPPLPGAASVTRASRRCCSIAIMRARWRSRGKAPPTCRPGASPGRSRAERRPGARSAAARRRPSWSPGWWPRRWSPSSGVLLASLPGGPPLWPFLVGAAAALGLLLALRAHHVARRPSPLRDRHEPGGRPPGAAARRSGGRRRRRARASSRSAWCARSPSTSGGASATTRAAA